MTTFERLKDAYKRLGTAQDKVQAIKTKRNYPPYRGDFRTSLEFMPLWLAGKSCNAQTI